MLFRALIVSLGYLCSYLTFTQATIVIQLLDLKRDFHFGCTTIKFLLYW